MRPLVNKNLRKEDAQPCGLELDKGFERNEKKECVGAVRVKEGERKRERDQGDGERVCVCVCVCEREREREREREN